MCEFYHTKIQNKCFPLSVATGFPTGQTPLKTRLEEVCQAVLDGASEIDIVINRTLALLGDWKGMMNKCKYIYAAKKLAQVCSFTVPAAHSLQKIFTQNYSETSLFTKLQAFCVPCLPETLKFMRIKL